MMNQGRLDAIAASSDTHYHLNHKGMDIWTNGHILLKATVEGSRELAAIAPLWDKMEAREDSAADVKGFRVDESRDGASLYYRELVSSGGAKSLINEAYLRVMQEDGAAPFITTPEAHIAFRKDGELVGMVAPVRAGCGAQSDVSVVTDAMAFECMASAGNGWYLQKATSLRNELHRVRKELRAKRDAADDIQAEIAQLEAVCCFAAAYLIDGAVVEADHAPVRQPAEFPEDVNAFISGIASAHGCVADDVLGRSRERRIVAARRACVVALRARHLKIKQIASIFKTSNENVMYLMGTS